MQYIMHFEMLSTECYISASFVLIVKGKHRSIKISIIIVSTYFYLISAKFGCPAKFIAMVRRFHDRMLARIQNDGEFSDPFPVTNGVKQGCVLASTLFSMMFSAMLTDAF